MRFFFSYHSAGSASIRRIIGDRFNYHGVSERVPSEVHDCDNTDICASNCMEFTRWLVHYLGGRWPYTRAWSSARRQPRRLWAPISQRNWHDVLLCRRLAWYVQCYLLQEVIADCATDSCSEMMVELNANFSFPTVVLEHSAYISSVTWSPSELDVAFNSVGAYNYIKQSWNLPEASLVPRDLTTPFVLATTAQPGDAQRDYFLVNKVHYDDARMRVVCYGSELDLDEAMDDLGIQWGTYNSGSSAGGAAASTVSASVGASTWSSAAPSLTTVVSVVPGSTGVTTVALSTPMPTFVTINLTSESSTEIVRTPPPQTIAYTSSLTVTQHTVSTSMRTVTSETVLGTTMQIPTTVWATSECSLVERWPISSPKHVRRPIVAPPHISEFVCIKQGLMSPRHRTGSDVHVYFDIRDQHSTPNNTYKCHVQYCLQHRAW